MRSDIQVRKIVAGIERLSTAPAQRATGVHNAKQLGGIAALDPLAVFVLLLG